MLGWISHFTGRLSNTQSLHFCGAFSNRYLDLGIWGGGVLLGWTSPFTGRLSNTQSLYFCGALSNRYLDLGIWGGVCWAGLVTSLADCQIHNLCTSVELPQIGIWIWGFGGGGSFFNFFNFLLSFGMFNNISMFPHSGKKKLPVTSYVILENKT